MSRWSDWIDIELAKSRQGPLNDFGVYQIRAVTLSGEPIPISRIVGVDSSGILYVGRSGYRHQRSVLLRIEFENFSGSNILVASPMPEQRIHYNARHSFRAIACKSEQCFSPMKKLTRRSQTYSVTTFQDTVSCHRATLNCPVLDDILAMCLSVVSHSEKVAI